MSRTISPKVRRAFKTVRAATRGQRLLPKGVVWVVMSRPNGASVHAGAGTAFDAWSRCSQLWESEYERPAGRAKCDTVRLAIAVSLNYKAPSSETQFSIVRACRSDAEMRDLAAGFDAGLKSGAELA